MTWMISDHLTNEHRQALVALSDRTRRHVETMTEEAIAAYLAAKGGDSLGSLAQQIGLPWTLLLDEAVQYYLATADTLEVSPFNPPLEASTLPPGWTRPRH